MEEGERGKEEVLLRRGSHEGLQGLGGRRDSMKHHRRPIMRRRRRRRRKSLCVFASQILDVIFNLQPASKELVINSAISIARTNVNSLN